MSRSQFSELDPLLPKTEPAPEITSGDDFAKSNSAEVKYSDYDFNPHQSSELLSPCQPPTEIGQHQHYYGVSDSYIGKAANPAFENEHGHIGDDDDEESDSSGSTATKRALSSLASMFIVVVFFSIVATSLNHGGLGKYPPGQSPVPVPRPSHGDEHTRTQSTSLIPMPTRHPSQSIEERVHYILTSTPLIDGHNDLAIFLRAAYANNITSSKFRDDFENGGMASNVDLHRLREGMAGGAFWSAFVACPVPSYRTDDSNDDGSANHKGDKAEKEKGKDWKFLDEDYATAVSHTLQQVDLVQRLQRQYPDDFISPGSVYLPNGSISSTRDTMINAWRESGGRKLFGPISIEGLHQVPPSAPLAGLRLLYNLGVRAATLTWNCHNAFADAAMVWHGFEGELEVIDQKKVRGGLTDRGRQVVYEMNRLGMLVDISHTSYHTQLAVLGVKHDKRRDWTLPVEAAKNEFEGASIAPVIFSHSSAHSICAHPRNVRDDVLDQVKRTRSLVMVNFAPDFISCTPSSDKTKLPDFYEKNNTLHQVARHIVHIGSRIGYEYVGIGSDFDGMGELTPKGLEGVDKYPGLVAELLRMGVTDEEAKGVVGGNLLRVWGEVENVAAEMRRKGVEEGVDEVVGF